MTIEGANRETVITVGSFAATEAEARRWLREGRAGGGRAGPGG